MCHCLYSSSVLSAVHGHCLSTREWHTRNLNGLLTGLPRFFLRSIQLHRPGLRELIERALQYAGRGSGLALERGDRERVFLAPILTQIEELACAIELVVAIEGKLAQAMLTVHSLGE